MIVNMFLTIINASMDLNHQKMANLKRLKSQNQNENLQLFLNNDLSNDYFGIEMEGTVSSKQSRYCFFNQNTFDCLDNEPVDLFRNKTQSSKAYLPINETESDIKYQENAADDNLRFEKCEKNGKTFESMNLKNKVKTEKKYKNSINKTPVRKIKLRDKKNRSNLIRKKKQKKDDSDIYCILLIEREIQNNISQNITKKCFDTYCYYFNMLEIFRLRDDASSNSLISLILDNIMFGDYSFYIEEIKQRIGYYMETMKYFGLQSICIQTNTSLGFDEILLRPNKLFLNLLRNTLLLDFKENSLFIRNQNKEIGFFLSCLISNVLITKIEEHERISIFIKTLDNEYDIIEKSNNHIYISEKKLQFSIENLNPEKHKSSIKKKYKSNGTFYPPSYLNE